MDDYSQEENTDASRYSKRCLNFSQEEAKVLVSLVEKFKVIILNKSLNSAVNHVKDVAWAKITKTFNNQGFEHERSVENLKVKWENLKKCAKKKTQNVLDVELNEFDDFTRQIVSILCEAEKINYPITMETLKILEEESNEFASQRHKETYNSLEHEEQMECQEDNEFSEDNYGDNSRNIKRSMNFTPKENSLLLRCVRKEKKLVLSKVNKGNFKKLKDRAWDRITNEYNRLSPYKRSTKVLRTKFGNMKKIAKCVDVKDFVKKIGKKHKKLNEETVIEVKPEPVCELESFEYSENDDNDMNDDMYSSDLHEKTNEQNDFVPDPLSAVLNTDSGIDLISNHSENKEEVKLKIELLNYKMETAKLERKMIEYSMKCQEIENSLRIRSARLEAAASAMKLPTEHPALAYTEQEISAQRYLQQYNNET